MSEQSASAYDEERLAHLLETGLQCPPLSREALARIRSNVEAQWVVTSTSSQRWRNLRLVSVAACVAAIGVFAAFSWLDTAQGPVVGSVARIDAGSLVMRSPWFTDRALTTGSQLHAGDQLRTRGSVLIALQGQDTLRIAPDTQLSLQGPNRFELRAGEVYFDLPPGSTRSAPLRLLTAAGIVEHVGTQFEVATIDSGVRIRVREGTIQLLRSQGAELATAGTELLASAHGAVHREQFVTYGPQWAWVEALAPEYRIEGVSLENFLYRTAREAGLKVYFQDEHTRDVAARTSLHGSASGLSPLEALSSVLLTTSLRYELHGDSIHLRPAT